MGSKEAMPVTFAMALARDPEAMRRFLRLENEKQDHILACARKTQGYMAMQELVANTLGTAEDRFL